MQAADFRSDTFTLPTPAMRQAMATAELGDDVYREDPTVNRLEQELAAMTGMEAGLFMPSGTMTNQVALAVHAPRGSEVVMSAGTHVYEFEPGAMAAISGLLPRLLPHERGIFSLDDLKHVIRGFVHQAPTGLVVLENTHNFAGGTVLPLDYCAAVQDVVHANGLPIHLDGARAFNAAAALNEPIAAVCAGFDSVSICLSKGLAAPVGSVLLGSAAFIEEARRYRKMLGGGMRQAGILAAAGIVAINEMPQELLADHARAATLARGLAAVPGFTVDLESVQTNMVYVQVAGAAAVSESFRAAGVLCNALAHDRLRFVTHCMIDDEMVERAIRAAGQVQASA